MPISLCYGDRSEDGQRRTGVILRAGSASRSLRTIAPSNRVERATKLIRVARRKHQRFYRDRYDFRDPETFANVDVVQIADFDVVHGDDVARDLEFIFQHAAKRFGYIEI